MSDLVMKSSSILCSIGDVVLTLTISSFLNLETFSVFFLLHCNCKSIRSSVQMRLLSSSQVKICLFFCVFFAFLM